MSELQPPDVPYPHDHPCLLADGTFEHDMEWKHDSDDFRQWSWLECKQCGARDYDTPYEHEPLEGDVA